MRRWWQDMPGAGAARALAPGDLAGWPDRAMEDRLHRLSFCPVVLSEVYIIAQHLPLAVIDSPAGPELVADLRPRVLRRPAFDARGRIVLPYRPVATRQLPFIVEPDGTIARLTDSQAAPDVPRDTPLQKRLVSLLAAQVEGRQRMTAALRAAIAAGLIAPPPPAAGTETGPWTSPPLAVTARAAADRIDDCTDPLALRLVAVMLFARRNCRPASVTPIAEAPVRLSLARDEALRDRLFLSADDPIDFSRLMGDPAEPRG